MVAKYSPKYGKKRIKSERHSKNAVSVWNPSHSSSGKKLFKSLLPDDPRLSEHSGPSQRVKEALFDVCFHICFNTTAE